MIRVAVAGAAGRMGQTVCAAVEGAEDMELTGRADPALGTAVADVLGDADVLVDFTQPDQAARNAARGAGGRRARRDRDLGLRPGRACATRPRRLRRRRSSPRTSPIGAVLMMRFAAEASRIMERAEIVELHHPASSTRPRAPPRGPPR